jgi:hypothetical protein
MKRIRIYICVLLLLLLLVVQVAYGMSSANYRIDWNNLLTGSGGPAGSASYAANVTIGQTASKVSASANYQVGLGYWPGVSQIFQSFLIHLPLVSR